MSGTSPFRIYHTREVFLPCASGIRVEQLIPNQPAAKLLCREKRRPSGHSQDAGTSVEGLALCRRRFSA